MALKYVKGDLIQMFKKNQFDYLLHQCNCFSSGAGFAGALFNEYPDAKPLSQYSYAHVRFGTNDYKPTLNGMIVNMFSQFNPGGCTETGADSFSIRMKALELCLKDINTSISVHSKIGMPLIASGIAADKVMKQNMSDIEYFKLYIATLVNHCLPDRDVTVVYL